MNENEKKITAEIDRIRIDIEWMMSEYKWNYWLSGFTCGCLTGVLISIVASIVYIHTR